MTEAVTPYAKIKEDFSSRKVKADPLFSFRIDNPAYMNVQGGYFDGENYYCAFIRFFGQGEQDAIIGVFDKNGRFVKQSDVLDIFHANAISDLGDGRLLVSDCHKTAEGGWIYSILDKNSLTVLEKGSVPFTAIAIDYCRENRRFAVTGEGYGVECRILDEKMNPVLKKDIAIAPYVAPQNFFCTKEILYSPKYIYEEGVGFTNFLYLYSWNLELLDILHFDTPKQQEAEAVSVIDGTAYVQCGCHDDGKVTIYKIDLT